MCEWICRKAGLADKDSINELFIEMIKTIYGGKDAAGYEIGYLDRFFENTGDWICVTEQDHTVIAFLSMENHTDGGGYLYLDDFSVHEPCRGKGIGSAMIGTAETYAHEKNLSVIRLHVEKTNERAYHFYERHGFQIEKDDGARLLMRKDVRRTL